jgi:hypothetical protein
MSGRHAHDERRRRQDGRLARLRGRIVVVSSLGFATLFGLAANHSVAASKHAATRPVGRAESPRPATRFFDEQADGFAFDDTSRTASAVAQPAPPDAQNPPAVTQSQPVAQSSVS